MKKLFPLLLLALIFPVAPAEAAPNYDRTCGILPGDGYYSFVRAKNMSCRHGKRVTNKARKKFCRSRSNCLIAPSNYRAKHRGKVIRNGWRCKVAVGYEYSRVKCRKGDRVTIAMSAA